MEMGLQKSFLTNKLGPLPTWAWMLIGLGIAVTIAVIRSNKAAAAKKTAEQPDTSTDSSTGDVDLIGGNQRPPIVFQNYSTSIFQPPAGGRAMPPAAPPATTLPPGPGTPAPPTTTTAPPTNTSHGSWVTVARWTAHNAPWNSTLYGIAAHVKHNGNLWPSIWNAPQNAALKARRKKPEEIRAGDKIFVPA